MNENAYLEELFRKMTKRHDVFGVQLSYDDLKFNKQLKVYHDDKNHDRRSLIQLSTGQLCLFYFHEEMGFPNDSIYEHFFFVASEEEADSISTKEMFELKTAVQKWIYVGPNFELIAVGG